MKKYIKGIIIGLILAGSLSASVAYAQIGSINYFKKVGDQIQLLKDSWTFYASNASFDNVEIGGISAGDLDMNGNDIINIGSASTTGNIYVGGDLEVIGSITASSFEIDSATGFFKIYDINDPLKYGQLDHDGTYFNISSSAGTIWMKNATVFQSTAHFGGISGADSFIRADSSYDQFQFGLGSNYGRAMVISDAGFKDYDFPVQTNPAIYLISGANTSTQHLKISHDQTTSVFDVLTGGFTFNASSTDNALVVKSDGKVGIGTSSPRSRFDIGYFYTPDTDGNNGEVLKTNGNGALTWQEDSSIDDGTATGQTTVWDGSAWTPTSSLMVVGEKVGIGTDSPSNALHIAQSGYSVLGLDAYGTGIYEDGEITFRKTKNNTVGSFGATDTGSSLGSINSYGSDGSAFKYGGRIQFVQNGTTAGTYTPTDLKFAVSDGTDFNTIMTIAHDNKVGIGTDSPDTKMHILSEDATGYFRTESYRDSAGGAGLFVERARGTASSPAVIQAGDDLLALLATGWDGDEFVNSGYIKLSADTNGTIANNIMPSMFTVQTTNDAGVLSEKMRIDKDGWVGIGTNAPDGQLHILGENNLIGIEDIGSGSAGGTIMMRKAHGVVGALTTVVDNESIGKLQFNPYDGNDYNRTAMIEARINGTVSDEVIPTDLVFYTSPANSVIEQMRIMSSGNVGIGTSTPATNLHVYDSTATGTLYFDGVNGGQAVVKDTNGTTCTGVTTLNGVPTWSVVTCPTP